GARIGRRICPGARRDAEGGRGKDVTSGENDEEAAWLDLIEHYDAPAGADAGHKPWPERENLAENNATIPGTSRATRAPEAPPANGGTRPPAVGPDPPPPTPPHLHAPGPPSPLRASSAGRTGPGPASPAGRRRDPGPRPGRRCRRSTTSPRRLRRCPSWTR